MFHYFPLDDSKQYAATTTAQIKRLIELFKKQKFCRPHYVQYGKILMVVQNNIDVPHQYTLCQ